MNALRLLAPIVAGLVVVLTYFLVQGLTINTPRHERADILQAAVRRLSIDPTRGS